MSRDLTCNETLGVEDSERNKESMVRRFPASQNANASAFRANYNTSSPSVKYTIQKPAPRPPYPAANAAPHPVHAPGTSTITPTEETLHGQLAAVSHVQLQNSNGAKLYKSLSASSEYPSPAGISPSQLHIIAGSTLLRNAVAAAGYREERPSSNSAATHTSNYATQLHTNAMQANLYSTINSMRLQQQHHAPPNTGKSPGAVALAAVQAAAAARTPIDPLRHGAYHAQVMYKNLVPQVPQPTLITRPPVTASPHVVNRYSSQNGVKQSSSPTIVRAQTTPHYVVPHQTVASPSRLVAGSHGSYHLQAPPMASVIPGSPGPPAQIQQIISTPSPRPSILRKRGDGTGTPVAAKRRLPFMDETPSSPSSSSQSAAPPYNAGPTPPAFQPSKESVNGTPEESPRKRMRKQQFETDAIPEQIKMAINVMQPIAGGSGTWKFAGHPGFITPGVVEKKKRGRPRTNSRPATALPIELHQSVSVFVDIDSPEEKIKPSSIAESITRGSAASVPPVHIEVPKAKAEVKEEAEDVDEVKADNTEHHDTSGEESIVTPKLPHRKKAKLNKSPKGLRSSWRQKSARMNADIASKCGLSIEEQQAEDVAGFLADCLEESKKEQRVRQKIRELDPIPSGSKTFFDMVPQNRFPHTQASAHPYSIQTWRLPKDGNLLANHFNTVEEFESTYEKYRKLKHLQRQEAKFNSSVHIREAAERCVEYCEKNVMSFCASLGFQPPTTNNDVAKDDLISLMENVLKERLETAEGFACAGPSLSHVGGVSRLPLVKCVESKDDTMLMDDSSDTTKSRDPDMDEKSASRFDSKDIEQLVDEMVFFVTRDEANSTFEEFVDRSFTREVIGRPVKAQCGQKATNGILSSRRARARLLQSDSFASVLKNVKSFLNESHELFDNVFSTGSSYQSRSWWNIVTSKRTRRKRRRISCRKVSSSLELPESNQSPCSLRESKSPVVSEESAAEMNLLSLREELAVRLHHMNLRVSEQIRFEEKLLEIFDRFFEAYNPKDHWKAMLDMERDFEDGDTEAIVHQKRIERLRYVLMMPPGKLAPDKKPDFGDHCGSIINCPDEIEMNRHMMGISPFWRGPMVKSNTKGFYLTRTGRRMHDRDESYAPLDENHREYYLEDLVDYREPTRLRKDYSTMERIWSQLENLEICPSKPVPKKEPDRGNWISRRKLATFTHKEVVCLGSVQTDVLKIPEYDDAPNHVEEAKEFLSRGASTREILATAFKAIRQTTMMMIQTRNAILELVHNVVEDGEEEEDDQDESVDDEEEFSRQMEQAVQDSFQDLQSTSKA
ncbi:hypothetical protein Y032_0023g838 [Ancylostoma ceylanicum]|uniref:TFIIS central domain-containing protein n=1 Tax=Ancylostoma ceylanicum TaxID=53326 RepID=A0A016UZ67_9BILA|nr:hypothetical protein Y032_0023g838 [Ancylostoma ceylanicum]